MDFYFPNGILTLGFNNASDLTIKAVDRNRNRPPASTFIYGSGKTSNNPPLCNELLRIFTPLVGGHLDYHAHEPDPWPTGKRVEIDTARPGDKIILAAPPQKKGYLFLGIMGQNLGARCFYEVRVLPYGKIGPNSDGAKATYLGHALANLLALQP